MSIRPIAFDEATQVYTMYHDELGHEFAVLLADLVFASMPGADPLVKSHSGLLINCPTCGAQSWHPVGGGADPANVQRLFVDKTVLDGCVCGNVESGNVNLAEAHAHLNCARMDGPDRWVTGA